MMPGRKLLDTHEDLHLVRWETESVAAHGPKENGTERRFI